MAIRSTRLKCSKHQVWLVLKVWWVEKVPIEFWACPLDCGYVRANKFQKKPVKPRRASIGTRARAVSHKSDSRLADDRQASFSF